MNKKTLYLFSTLCLLLLFTFVEVAYLSVNKTLNNKDIKDKNSLVSILELPDLAISTEAMYIRHRTLSDTFNILKEDPQLKEYFPTTFVYSYSHILKNTPSKILNEK
ncbi:hypothetical protein [Halarcobacter sp.]|uniref:hypothetical protein n=1 Tax=Halarcobacter sp. TaxID=2321133 RepID=UPI0029F4B9F9|nr:hypothetical protein [Halarcobacter sp.]